MISYDHWSQQTLSKTELGVHCNQVPLLLPFLPLLFFKLAFLCHSCQSPFNRLPGYMDGWTVGGWLFVWTGGGRALMSHSLQSSLYSAYMSTASGGQGRSCSKYTLGIMLFWFCWISPDMHSCKKCFCLREPVFWGRIFLISRRNFLKIYCASCTRRIYIDDHYKPLGEKGITEQMGHSNFGTTWSQNTVTATLRI